MSGAYGCEQPRPGTPPKQESEQGRHMDHMIVNAQRAMLLVGRGLLGLYFILPGISKITGFAGMSEYMAAHRVPRPDGDRFQIYCPCGKKN